MNKKLLRKNNAYDCVLEELKVLQRLEHPHIIWLYEIIDDPKKDDLFLVTEYHSKGSLGQMIEEKNKRYESYNKKCIDEGNP